MPSLLVSIHDYLCGENGCSRALTIAAKGLAVILAVQLAIALVFAVYSVGYTALAKGVDAISLKSGKWTLAYRWRRRIEKLVGRLWWLGLLLMIGIGLPLGLALLVYAAPPGDGIDFALPAVLGAIGGLIAWLSRAKTAIKSLPAPVQSKLIPIGVGIAMLGLLAVVANAASVAVDTGWSWWLLLPAALVTLGFVMNINYLGHHRFYRDRLMEAFMPSWTPSPGGAAEPTAAPADLAMLVEFGCEGSPYHIINTNVVLANADNALIRGRGGDNFILTPAFCGSSSTGWRATASYMKRTAKTNGLTLATAMAVSGAAVNPHGTPVTRNVLYAFVMWVFNARLGYFVPNPSGERGSARLIPAGVLGALGFGFHEKAAYLELTDGGHFENIGLYELFRRRLRVIVAADAECDPDYVFDGLSTAIERARLDFGAVIDMEPSIGELQAVASRLLGASAPPAISPAPLSGVVSATASSGFASQVRVAARGFAIGIVTYPDQPGRPSTQSLLFYVKSTLVESLPTDLLRYRAGSPDYPHETTMDQFFDEGQFEAYRELGYRLTGSMLRHPLAEAVLY
ncbi:MAG: hypothetical protein FJX60_20995 [Alphaproteobacteria bacterium]|nr:hypothetical protein [Alphaproteobacteria bacterium]